MSSHLAGLVSLIQTALASPPMIGGISPPPLPDDAALPYITVHEVLGKELQTLDSNLSGLDRTVMQVNVWDNNYEAAWAVRESVKQHLLGYSDSDVEPISHVSDAELYNGPTMKHQLICRLLIWWKE